MLKDITSKAISINLQELLSLNDFEEIKNAQKGDDNSFIIEYTNGKKYTFIILHELQNEYFKIADKNLTVIK